MNAPEPADPNADRPRCARANRCRDRDDKHRGKPLEDDDRLPFCPPCMRALDRALDDASDVFDALRGYSARQIGAQAGGDQVSGSKAPPVPVDVGVIALGDELVFVLRSWDRIVRSSKRLTVPRYVGRCDPSRTNPRQATHSTIVRRAALLLWAHREHLVALPAHAVHVTRDTAEDAGEDFARHLERRHTPRGVYVVMTGADAAGWLIDWHGRVRSRLGMGRRFVHRTKFPCPACDVIALERDDGSEWIECRACGKGWTQDDFEIFVPAWAEAAKRRRAS